MCIRDSVYIDTIVICTASAMIIMVTGNYNVSDGAGNLIVSNTSSEYGALWAQDAVLSLIHIYCPFSWRLSGKLYLSYPGSKSLEGKQCLLHDTGGTEEK